MTLNNPDPIIFVISTGTEILQGHSVDRNSPWISEQLLSLGLSTAGHIAIPDRASALREGLGDVARRADLVITTGGLGPTGDDLNRQVIADVWGVQLEENAEALERIRERFRRRGREMTPNNRVQALIPQGAIILQNDNGTAPGFYLRARSASTGVRASLLALPGPPREMQPMFRTQAAPLVGEDFAGGRARLRTLTFHTAGLPESQVDSRLKDLYDTDPEVNLALLASLGHVQIRLTLMGADVAANDRLAAAWRDKIHERIGADAIYGEDDETLEGVVGALLRERAQTLATAESCTGGLLAGRLTDIAGSSDYFLEGFITYANEAKTASLGVPPELLAKYGAVSGEVAEAMAEGARRAAGSDWAVSVTGVAGPGGGTEDKPVGLVYLGLCDPQGRCLHLRQVFTGDRQGVRSQATQAALELLRRRMLGI